MDGECEGEENKSITGVAFINKIKSINQDGDYYFCNLCNKWHRYRTEDHLQNRLRIKRDDNIKPRPFAKKLRVQQRSGAHYSEGTEIDSFDVAHRWKSESEHILSIPSPEARRSCENILALVNSTDKDLHLQYFSRTKGFSFMVKGLRIAEIKIGSSFILSLIQNTKVPGHTIPKQLINKFTFSVLEIPPISDSELRNHFITEAKNLINLRESR